MRSTAPGAPSSGKHIMTNDALLQYEKQIDAAIARYAGWRDADYKRDLKQEALIALINAGRVDGPGHAYVIVRNHLLNYLQRDLTVYEDSFDDLQESLPDLASPVMAVRHMEDVDRRLDLEKAIGTLSREDQVLVDLLFRQGYTNEEAAAILDWSLRTVEGHRAAIINKIKTFLGEK